jgi:hypothetical protein
MTARSTAPKSRFGRILASSVEFPRDGPNQVLVVAEPLLDRIGKHLISLTGRLL